MRRTIAGLSAALTSWIGLASCSFDTSVRWLTPEPEPPPEPLCILGERRCTSAVEECAQGSAGLEWKVIDDCAEKDQLCASGLWQCVNCIPNEAFCKGLLVMQCDSAGETSSQIAECDPTAGEACRSGDCLDLCDDALEHKSNVGCEYWAVDLDNAMIDATNNAAAQQFAVVVSNPQPDVPVTVRIEQDDGEPGGAHLPIEIASAVLGPLNLRVFKLGPREVDGSPDGEYDTGTHTALTRHGYRITTDFPVVAYQFNPLENVAVFSNDASLLKPREALTYEGDSVSVAYVVSGWPQTIAVTDDPNTNFSSTDPINLRSFLTIAGTQPDTTVRVLTSTVIREGGPIPATPPGIALELTIDDFDVINLETPDHNSFNADFTGTIIEADKPIAVFSGSEAADAPHFESLTERRCCADHLEEQLDPIRTAGRQFALAHSPSRTKTVKVAGGDLGVADEPEYFRFLATSEETTTVTTTLPAPDDQFTLTGRGDFYEIESLGDFLAEADKPIHVTQINASQDAANVPRVLPGGDPSLMVVPPIEQYRNEYVFLTPDKYAFDFVVVVAPAGAEVLLDGQPLSLLDCESGPTDGLTSEERGGDPELYTWRCQLSFATVDPDSGMVTPGLQNDGVHRITANLPVGVTVFGFDSFVSYAYAGGTDLRDISIPE